MADKTKIQWADSCVNFWWGCRRVSPGCENCYIAQSTPFRANHMKHGSDRRKSKSAVKDALKFNRQPLICDECGGANDLESCEEDTLLCQHCCESTMNYHTRRIFSLSLGDWLDEEVPIEWLAEMLDMIRKCDQVIWILCTKRPEIWSELMQSIARDTLYGGLGEPVPSVAEFYRWLYEWLDGKAPQNVCLLTSVENQETADKRIPELLKIPARWHGLSCEPLLGPVDLVPWIRWDHSKDEYGIKDSTVETELDWLIVGGESGQNARSCNIDWVRSIVEQGNAGGLATFVKQLGPKPFHEPGATRLFWLMNDKKGGDMSEWPKDLRVREFPKGF